MKKILGTITAVIAMMFALTGCTAGAAGAGADDDGILHSRDCGDRERHAGRRSGVAAAGAGFHLQQI